MIRETGEHWRFGIFCLRLLKPGCSFEDINRCWSKSALVMSIPRLTTGINILSSRYPFGRRRPTQDFGKHTGVEIVLNSSCSHQTC